MASAAEIPGLIDPLSQEILHSDTNWFLVEFASTGQKNKYAVQFSGKGTGGLTELRSNLTADDRIFYGSLQVNLIDEEGRKYDKYVYFKYLPNKANKAKRHLWGFENPIKNSFKFKHVSMEYLDENLVGFDEQGIAKEFLRVSENQMEYKSIDFGGNNIYVISDGNIKKGRPADMDSNYAQAQAQAVQQVEEKVDVPDDPQPEPQPDPEPAAAEPAAEETYDAPDAGADEPEADAQPEDAYGADAGADETTEAPQEDAYEAPDDAAEQPDEQETY